MGLYSNSPYPNPTSTEVISGHALGPPSGFSKPDWDVLIPKQTIKLEGKIGTDGETGQGKLNDILISDHECKHGIDREKHK